MEPDHLKGRHYCGGLGRIVWILGLFLLVHDVTGSDSSHEAKGAGSSGADQQPSPDLERVPGQSQPGERGREPEDPEGGEKVYAGSYPGTGLRGRPVDGRMSVPQGDGPSDGDSEMGSWGRTHERLGLADEPVDDFVTTSQRRAHEQLGLADEPVDDEIPERWKEGQPYDESIEQSHLIYTATTGTTFMNMLGGSGEDAAFGVPDELILEQLRRIEEENSKPNRRAWPVIVFENDIVACACLAIHDLDSDELLYEGFLMRPETINKEEALRTLVKEMLKPPASCRVDYVNVVTPANDGLLIDALAKAGVSLMSYIENPSGFGMGMYSWKIDMPYLGSYSEHRHRQIETMGEWIYVMRQKAGVNDGMREYFSTSEREVFDTVVVKASSALSPQEQMRAARFVREKAKGELYRGAVVDSGYPTSFSVVAVGNETGTVYGVLKGHVEDLICTIEFLGASGLHENFVEAMLLADTLPFMERLGVRKVVLKSIPICDAGMVGLAAELGFVIKASSGDSHLMVRDGSLPPPDTDCITLPRSFRAQYGVLKNFEGRHRAPIDGKYLDVLELARMMVYEAPGFIKRRTQELFLQVGVVVIIVCLIMMARTLQLARKREAQRKRVRYAHLPDDVQQEREGAPAAAVTEEYGSEAQLEAVGHTM